MGHPDAGRWVARGYITRQRCFAFLAGWLSACLYIYVAMWAFGWWLK